MKRRLQWITIGCAIALATYAAAQVGASPGQNPSQGGPGAIEGVARRPDTGEPLAEVTVYLTGGNPAPLLAPVITDSSGRFVFRNLQLATYVVHAGKPAHYPGGSTANPPRGNAAAEFNQLINLTSQQPAATVAVTLLPATSISGRVLDSNGRPVAGAQVQAMVRNYQSGRGALARGSQVQTDDRGDFRLWGLAAGEYFLRASFRSTGARRGSAELETTYYPFGPDLRTASPLKVIPGIDTIVDIRMGMGSPIILTIHATSADPNAAVDNAQFVLIPKDWPRADDTEAELVRQGRAAAGGIQVQVQRPGNYELIAVVPAAVAPADARNNRGANGIGYIGKTAVVIREGSNDPITVPVVPTFNLEMQFNTNSIPTPNNPIRLFFTLIPRDGALPGSLFPREIGARGARGAIESTRLFGPVAKGQYLLETNGSSASAYIADVRQGGKSILEDGIVTIDREPADPVEVVFAQPGGTIEGVVQDSQGNPVPTAQVLLIPDGPRRQNLLFYRKVIVLSLPPTNPGRFSIVGITPGTYKVFASEAMPAGAERSIEFMKPFESFGRSVTVTAGATVSGVVVPLIRSTP